MWTGLHPGSSLRRNPEDSDSCWSETASVLINISNNQRFSRNQTNIAPHLLSLFATFIAVAQEGFSLFTTDFPFEEFSKRCAAVYDAIGSSSLALVQGAAAPAGYARFRQSTEFYCLCGIETPHFYLLLEGARKWAALYLLTEKMDANGRREKCSLRKMKH
jgi:hypothetical protein